MFPVRYDLGFISQKTAFFIVTAVKTSNLTEIYHIPLSVYLRVYKHNFSPVYVLIKYT
jgi:hypothetical protein